MRDNDVYILLFIPEFISAIFNLIFFVIRLKICFNNLTLYWVSVRTIFTTLAIELSKSYRTWTRKTPACNFARFEDPRRGFSRYLRIIIENILQHIHSAKKNSRTLNIREIENVLQRGIVYMGAADFPASISVAKFRRSSREAASFISKRLGTFGPSCQ